MIKRPFFDLVKPRLRHPAVVGGEMQVKDLGLPAKVVLLAKGCNIGSINLKVGIGVKTGQRLQLTDDAAGYVISTVTGTISGISEYTGYLGQDYVSITIDVSGEDVWDEAGLEAIRTPTFETGRDYLGALPGKWDFSSFLNPQPPVNMVVVTGLDQDLLVSTRQSILKADVEGLIEGIDYLKKIARIGRVILAVPRGLSSLVGQAGAEVREIDPVYPNTLSGMIAKTVLAEGVVPGKGEEDMGIGFMSVEAVISLARAFSRGEIPVDKVLTVIGKDNEAVLTRVRVGTPVKDVLDALGIETAHGDRLVFGGPMRGEAVYSEDTPVMWDTDAVMVQSGDQVVLTEDVQCINCGECVRVCPARMPVNMLVRVLGKGFYEDAATQYDLFSCMECGLCNYVCVARIPIFHHIMLGKQEFARLTDAEGSNA